MSKIFGIELTTISELSQRGLCRLQLVPDVAEEERTPIVALVVDAPWAELLVDGTKTLELRKKTTIRRGTVAIAQAGTCTIIGRVRICGSQQIHMENISETVNLHRVSTAAAKSYAQNSSVLHGWMIEGARRFRSPRPYVHPKGAVGWVTLPRAFYDS